MYPVSNAFLDAVKANNRKYYWTGRITTTAGTVYEFDQDDMVKGSGYITSQCCGSTEIELGTVYAAEMGISLFSEINRYTLEYAKIELFYHLQVEGGSYEVVPIGIFEVSEANRKAKCLEIKAYDYMVRFEKAFTSLESIGNAYDRCKFCTMYKDVPFKMSPMEWIEEDLKELAESDPNARTIQILSANPLVLTYEKLAEVFEMIHRYLPKMEYIYVAGRVSDLKNKTADGYLQTTEGCSHNHCLFCTYFKDQKFRKATIEEIEEDIREIPKYFGAPKRIFLQGADGYAADYDVLMKTAELLHKYVPSVETIGGYARIDNFYDKTEEQLRDMAAVGFSNPYIGVESGDDVVLKKINKGYNAAQAREQLEKIDASGLPYIVNFLNGAGGHGYGLQNAQLTAKLYDGLHPTMVNTSMLTIVPGTPLYRAMEKGLYAESTEMEKLEEIYELVKCLTNDTIFMNEHASNLFHVQCRIPEQKEELLSYIRKFMEESDEKKLRQYREYITRAF